MTRAQERGSQFMIKLPVSKHKWVYKSQNFSVATLSAHRPTSYLQYNESHLPAKASLCLDSSQYAILFWENLRMTTSCSVYSTWWPSFFFFLSGPSLKAAWQITTIRRRTICYNRKLDYNYSPMLDYTSYDYTLLIWKKFTKVATCCIICNLATKLCQLF